MSTQWEGEDVERTDPALVAGEREALEEWLDWHRGTLLSKCARLGAEQLRERSVPPSKLSLLGLVRHMTEVERGWFRITARQEKIGDLYCTEETPEADFDELDSDPAEDMARFVAEVEAARAAVEGMDLDHVVPSAGHHPERVRNLRWIYLHMIEEYARHNGHADLIRERIDGVTGD